MIPERAQRMIEHMRHVLTSLAETTDLHHFTNLTNELSAAIGNLVGDVDDEWLNELRNAWFQLEHISAMALDSAQRKLTEHELRDVGRGIHELRVLLTEY